MPTRPSSIECTQQHVDAVLRQDLLAFVKKAFRELAPAEPVVQGWYLRAMAYELEQCLRGETKRLIINVPPRHLKSVAASVAFPAFLLGHDPSTRIVCASYSGELAAKHARDCRKVMMSPWYQRIFPGTRIGRDKNAEMDFVTTRQGYRLSTSVGGTLTGRGGNWLIVDDPLKPDEALSETRRKAAADWYDNTLYTRLDNKSSGVIIIVMQRLHMDDLVGHVTAREAGWRVLSLPSIAEEAHDIRTGPRPGDWMHRGAGDLLDPDREDHNVLANLRETLGSYNFSAQYQQSPIPVDGEIFRSGWFARFDVAPAGGQIVQSWDTAMKDTELNDYSVCSTWRIVDGRYYLLHVYRERLNYPSLVQAVIRQQASWGANLMLIEDKGSGTSLGQTLRAGVQGRRYSPIMIEPEGDKIMRAAAQSPLVEAGGVLLPTTAPWLEPFMREVLQFPNGKHDDQVDSMTQFLAWASKPRPGVQIGRVTGL